MKKLLIIIFLIGEISATQAQKASVNQAINAATQEKPDYNIAEKLIKEALVNNASKNDAYTWYAAGLIYNKKYEEEQNKKLLKQNCNQPLMHESFYNAYNYWTGIARRTKIGNRANITGDCLLKLLLLVSLRYCNRVFLE